MVLVVKMDTFVLIDHGLWLYVGSISCFPDEALLFILEVLWQIRFAIKLPGILLSLWVAVGGAWNLWSLEQNSGHPPACGVPLMYGTCFRPSPR